MGCNPSPSQIASEGPIGLLVSTAMDRGTPPGSNRMLSSDAKTPGYTYVWSSLCSR